MLPGEEELSVPFCLPPGVLPEFQHAALQAGAEAQRERLAALFPGLASPRATGGLPPLLRTYALVRSRAFRASEDSFAFVPFLDAANHAPDPNADFRRDDAGAPSSALGQNSLDLDAGVGKRTLQTISALRVIGQTYIYMYVCSYIYIHI